MIHNKLRIDLGRGSAIDAFLVFSEKLNDDSILPHV